MTVAVSLCITSYNRKKQLEACVDSFFKTNTFDLDKLELIIIDNGSDDGVTADFVRNLSVPCRYTFLSNDVNDYPFCLRRAKNQARELAEGKVFIDCPDDHLFVVKSNWINDTVQYLNETEHKVSCVCHYAYPAYRFLKPNNAMSADTKNSNYYISHIKGYADYHIMKRSVYQEIGKYREDLAFNPNAESDYMERAAKLGYRRCLLKYPVSIINEECFSLVTPIESSEYQQLYDIMYRPVDNEALTDLATRKGHIIKK